MAAIAQEPRLLSISTPLGADKLVLQSFTGSEAFSSLYTYHLDMVSEDEGIAPADIVGNNVTFQVTQADLEPRFFNGFVNRFVAGALHTRGQRNYRAEVVPWLWFLTRTSDCRIFQNQTLPQIIEQVFNDLGFSDYELDLQGDHPEHVYCVQYRETAFNFVSRLMEEEGMFYWFAHEDGKHTLKLVDHKGAYTDCPEKEIDYVPGSLSADHITSWEHRYEFRSGQYTQTDYNFETPSTSLETNTSTILTLPSVDKYELYDFPGDYGLKSDGETLTRLRMEEEEVPHDIVDCASACRTVHAGGKFSISRHECTSEEGKSYVITSVHHSATDHTHLAGGGEASYQNVFSCIPDSVVFRSGRVTPKPEVRGPQTAVVVGPSGEEIYPDEFGRVKVQFHWDRVGKNDENSSCWVRVSSPWAGKAWGGVAIPRIGQEVIVDFLEGDIDSPIITGRVYNAEQMPPYDLPENKTQMGIKSRSTKGGSAENFNEIRFEDKKGEEQVYIHAEKNQDNVVENDETTSVGNNRTEDVGKDETITIGENRTENVGKNESITIAENRTESVGKDESISIGDNRMESVGKDETISIGANRTEDVAKDELISIGENRTESVGKKESVSIGDDREHSVGKDDSLSVGKSLLINAGDEILMKTGSATLHMKKDGTITIEGKDITLKGSGAINIKASKNVVLKGKKVLQN